MIKKIIIILLIILNTGFSDEKNQDAELYSNIKNQVIKDVTSGLVINIFYNSYDDHYGNTIKNTADVLEIFTDSNMVQEIQIEPLGEKISIGDKKYDLFEYYLTGTLINVGSSEAKFIAISGYQFVGPVYLIYQLFRTGIYAVSENKKTIFKYNDERHCILKNDSSFVELEEKLKLMYFHYLPKEVKVDINNSSFSFFSSALDRYCNGRITGFDYYKLELINGKLR